MKTLVSFCEKQACRKIAKVQIASLATISRTRRRKRTVFDNVRKAHNKPQEGLILAKTNPLIHGKVVLENKYKLDLNLITFLFVNAKDPLSFLAVVVC